MAQELITEAGNTGQQLPGMVAHLSVAAGAIAGWGLQVWWLTAPALTPVVLPRATAAVPAAVHPAWLLAAWLLPWGVASTALCLRRTRKAIAGRCLHAGSMLLLGLAGLLQAALLQQAMRPAAGLLPEADGLAPEVLRLLALVAVPALLAALGVAGWMAHRYDRLLARTRQHLQQAAGLHALTGLPSRQRFELALQAAAMQADRRKQRIAVLCINVDGLKTINESFGPAAGDALLCAMARRLQRLTGPHDSVAHAAGDEFLMLLAGNPDRETAARAATHLIDRLSEALRLDAREVATSCSVGLAMYPEDGAMRTLVTRAGAAVRCAKRNGRASHCFYEPQMTEGTRDQVDLLHDLRRAIERRQLELFYQPKVQAVGGRVTGAEALLRWRHPSRGLVSPVVFVPLAERSGLIGALGDWVIEEACRQIAAWQVAGQPLPVSINLSVHQLRQPDLVQRIRAAMVRHQVPPGRLRCEITESAAMDDTGTTLALVQELAAAGVPLAVDDFGTGYSSLGYLRKLPVSELKIDRSFVMDLHTSADARAIVDAVIRLAHALGLTVVAEGVETEAQCRILQRLGCDELQGYLFAKPMAARMLNTWAADLAPAPAAKPQTAGTSVALR